MNRHITQVGILGSGVMGSQIACLLAGIGIKVTILDIPTPENFKPNNSDRNAWVNAHLTQASKMNPSPLYSKKNLKLIRTGNFEDNMDWMSDMDWIIEVVVEKLDVKKKIFEQIDAIRKESSIVSSNTSGIPIHKMTEGRSESFKKNFLGTHFFNPPRYLRLLEIIPTTETSTEVTQFMMNFGEKFLGKQTVLAKDTPAFIGNRIGVYSIATILNYVSNHDISIQEVDILTGQILGRPKSATFRTADMVGIDTLALVADSLAESVPQDANRAEFKMPDFIQTMKDKNWLGDKTKQGFYKKIKKEDNTSEILALNLKTLEYEPSQKLNLSVIKQAKAATKLSDRITILLEDNGSAGDFYRHTIWPLWNYITHRIPEIADHLYQIDDAIEAGFNWETGPFKLWDEYGIQKGIQGIESLGLKPALWLYDMMNAGKTHFFIIEDGRQKYYDIESGEYKLVPGTEDFLLLENIPADKTIWENSNAQIRELGDGIIHLDFYTKMNVIGTEVLQGINQAIDLAEQNYKGLVISNNGANFSSGAHVGLIFMMAIEQEYEELNWAIKYFQDTMMRIRYSSIPVVVAPHGMALGGGCEMCMHADVVVAHAELYMGLVEFGVGVIPGGGGTKEFALRLSDELKHEDTRLNRFKEKFLTIGQAQVSTSAQEAFELGYLRKGQDIIVHSKKRQLNEAKQQCLRISDRGYIQPVEREDIFVLGNEALGLAYVGADSMKQGRYISEYDKLISEKLALVLAGGELSYPTSVSERYLLDLERKTFLELCMNKKTLERLQSILTQGKVLRN